MRLVIELQDDENKQIGCVVEPVTRETLEADLIALLRDTDTIQALVSLDRIYARRKP